MTNRKPGESKRPYKIMFDTGNETLDPPTRSFATHAAAVKAFEKLPDKRHATIMCAMPERYGRFKP